MADEQLARTKAINMRHVYVIGVIALARTRVPAGENSPTVSPPLSPSIAQIYRLTYDRFSRAFRITVAIFVQPR